MNNNVNASVINKINSILEKGYNKNYRGVDEGIQELQELLCEIYNSYNMAPEVALSYFELLLTNNNIVASGRQDLTLGKILSTIYGSITAKNKGKKVFLNLLLNKPYSNNISSIRYPNGRAFFERWKEEVLNNIGAVGMVNVNAPIGIANNANAVMQAQNNIPIQPIQQQFVPVQYYNNGVNNRFTVQPYTKPTKVIMNNYKVLDKKDVQKDDGQSK